MKEMDSKNEIYLEEFHQAWEHYRHVENSRTKYMNFFFTALFAVIGLYSAILKLDQLPINEFELLVGFFLIIVFSVFSSYVLINITRIGWVLTGYSNVMKELRVRMYGKDGFPEEITVRKYLPKESKRKIYSIQTSAEILLISALVLSALFSLSIIIFYWNTFEPFNKTIMIGSLFLVLVVEIFIINNGRKKKKLVKRK